MPCQPKTRSPNRPSAPLRTDRVPTLIRIEDAGPDRKARRLFFEGVEHPRTTSAAATRALELNEGQVVDLDDLESALAAVEADQARERALRLLGYRERSVQELRQRLTYDGYPAPIVATTVDRMIELSLVDDARFASAWVRARQNAGFGPRRIRSELSRAGVSDEIASEALGECGEERDEIDRAREALRGRTASDRADRDRLVRRLVSRGFSLQTAIAAVAQDEPPVTD